MAAFAIIEAHHARYRKSLDFELLIVAICAAALEAGRGVEGQPGTLRAGGLEHLGTLRRLIGAAGLKPTLSGIREEYAAARERNVHLRREIQRLASARNGPVVLTSATK